jgi:deazaflavin-dependent oxidoreductase (nitroreductase family)
MTRNRRWKSGLALLALAGVAAVAVRKRRRGRRTAEGATGRETAGDATGRGTADQPSVAPAEPPAPEWAYDVINPLVERLLRSPLHGVVSDSLMLITFTGRKTGNEYTTPVGYRQSGDTLTVFTQSDWWKNLRGGQPVRVHLRGEERSGVAEATADPDAVAERVRRFVAEEGIEKARRIGLRVEGERLPGDEELAAGVEGLVAIGIELDE